MAARIRLLFAAAFVLTLAPLSACSRGRSEGAAAPSQPPASVAASSTTEAPALAQATTIPELSPTAPPGTSGTPAPTPMPAPTGPTPTAAPRIVNGLMVVDETWVGVIREAGGLRVRSAPRVEPGNVVGSVAEGTPVNVSGRVLNGQEAESGKGAVWLIVGPNQYVYAAPGYVERLR